MAEKAHTEKLPAIPTTYMPEDWRTQGAEKFGCSTAKIEKIVYGQRKPDIRIYEFMLALAEAGKAAYDEKMKELSTRVTALS